MKLSRIASQIQDCERDLKAMALLNGKASQLCEPDTWQWKAFIANYEFMENIAKGNGVQDPLGNMDEALDEGCDF